MLPMQMINTRLGKRAETDSGDGGSCVISLLFIGQETKSGNFCQIRVVLADDVFKISKSVKSGFRL